MCARRPHVLVVDDEPAIRSLLRDLIDGIGADVDAASDATTALAMVRDRSYELVITDHAMPGMSGLEMIDLIKVQHPAIPVVLLTGSLQPDQVEQLQKTGLPVFTKPMSVLPFQKAVARLLADAPVGRSAADEQSSERDGPAS